MFYLTDLVLCVLACLVQTALTQSEKVYNGSSGGSSNCDPYGGAGTGQVGVAGDIGACGATCVVGRVPVIGAVEFDGCSPTCGSVCISGQCACDSQPEETFLAPVVSTTDFFGKSSAVAISMPNQDLSGGFLEQCNCPQITSTGQCDCGKGCLNAPLVSFSSPSSIALKLPLASVSSPSSFSLNEPTTILSAPGISLNAPSVVSSPSVTASDSRIVASPNSFSLNTPSSASAPGCASYGGAGTGQVGVSGDIGACGETIVIGSVPVRGSVDFGGCTPTSGCVCISGLCECGCD